MQALLATQDAAAEHLDRLRVKKPHKRLILRQLQLEAQKATGSKKNAVFVDKSFDTIYAQPGADDAWFTQYKARSHEAKLLAALSSEGKRYKKLIKMCRRGMIAADATVYDGVPLLNWVSPFPP